MKRLLIIYVTISLFACGRKENDSNSMTTQSALQKTDSVESTDFDPDGYYYSKDTFTYKQFALSTQNILDIETRLSYKKRQSRKIFVEFRFYSVLEGASHRHI